MRKARCLLRGCRAQRRGRAARGTRPQLIQSRAYARSVHAHRAPTCVSRCAAARTARSMRACRPLGVAALRGERQASRAHATRPSPRPRPSAEPKAPGSAPLPSSWPAAPQAPGVASTLSLCGAFDSSPPVTPPPPLQRCRFRPRRARAPAPHRRRSAAAVAAAAQGPARHRRRRRRNQTPTTLSSSATVEMARLCGTLYRIIILIEEKLWSLCIACATVSRRAPVLVLYTCKLHKTVCAFGVTASGGAARWQPPAATASRLSQLTHREINEISISSPLTRALAPPLARHTAGRRTRQRAACCRT